MNSLKKKFIEQPEKTLGIINIGKAKENIASTEIGSNKNNWD